MRSMTPERFTKMKILEYIKARLSEPSTWAAISAGAAAAAAVTAPWSYLVAACAVIAALLPEKSAA